MRFWRVRLIIIKATEEIAGVRTRRKTTKASMTIVKQLFSPKELAQAIGASQSSVKRWADSGEIEVTRTAGGHRKIHISEVIRFLRSRQTPLVAPHILGLPRDLASPQLENDPATGDAPGRRLAEFLKAGKAAECTRLLLSLFLSGTSIADMGDTLIREAMAEVGELWRHETDRGIYLEHRATQICTHICFTLKSLAKRGHGPWPLALGGAPENDPYQLPSLLVAASLTEIGFEAIDLGADTPLRSLKKAVIDLKPQLVWLSLSTETAKDPASQIRELCELTRSQGAALLIGGRASGNLSLPNEIEGLDHCRTLNELTAFARGWIGSQPA